MEFNFDAWYSEGSEHSSEAAPGAADKKAKKAARQKHGKEALRYFRILCFLKLTIYDIGLINNSLGCAEKEVTF
ncbi:MAG: hypothetical protein ACNS61_02800 [Candidatus Wenzhouxiangella sp. M2_3B_020]